MFYIGYSVVITVGERADLKILGFVEDLILLDIKK